MGGASPRGRRLPARLTLAARAAWTAALLAAPPPAFAVDAASPFQVAPRPAPPSRPGAATVDLHATPPGFYVSAQGTVLDYCSVAGCLPGPFLLAQSLFDVTTRLDASAQEVGMAMNLVNQTGKVVPWEPRHAYGRGDEVRTQAGQIFKAETAGVSGDRAPVAGGDGRDGSTRWTSVGPDLNGGKSLLSLATLSKPGGGPAWTFVTDHVVQPGVGDVNQFGYEQDCSNYNKDSSLSSRYLMACFFQGGQGEGTFPMLAYRLTSSSSPSAFGAHFGDLFQGDKTIEEATWADATSAFFGIHFIGAENSHVHGGATFFDETWSPRSIRIDGHHDVDIDLSGSKAPVALSLPSAGAIAFDGERAALRFDPATRCLGYGALSIDARPALAMCEDGAMQAARSVSAPVVTVGRALKLPAYRVDDLPACDGSTMDAIAVAADAKEFVSHARPEGRGRVRTPVYCDGASWSMM